MKLEDQDWKDPRNAPVAHFVSDDSDHPLSAVVLIVAGCILGLLIMFAAQTCNRQPMPAVTRITGSINCQYCHGVRLNNAKRYARYWQTRKSVDQTRLISARDDDAENERMVNLIMGGK